MKPNHKTIADIAKAVRRTFFMLFLLPVFLTSSCADEADIPPEEVIEQTDPPYLKVITADVSEVTASSVVSGGNAIEGENSPVLARGVVWNTETDPDIHAHLGMTSDGEGEGAFTSLVDGLAPETIYYLRAYAVTPDTTIYGAQLVFSTVSDHVTLEEWILGNPRIMHAINWDETNYSDWPEGRKNLLQVHYTWRINEMEDLDAYPPENLYQLVNPWDRVVTLYSERDALSLYMMNVANSLFMERNQLLAWSLLSDDYSDEDLEILLDGRHFMQGYGGEDLVEMHMFTLPAPPLYTISFLNKEGILVENRRETIYRIVDWTSAYLLHFSGGLTMQNFFNHWGYYGAVPVIEMINGRYRADGPIPGVNIYHWTAGCHGTTTFFQSILRTVNIPVEYIYYAEHGFPRFGGDKLYLCHGDSPYSRYFAEADPPIDPAKLLLDANTWKSWFPEDEMGPYHSNIGRRPFELGVEYLSYGLLNQYCRVTSTGIRFINTSMYHNLTEIYSPEELSDLEARILEKIAEYGDCENIPTTRLRYYQVP